MAKSNLKNLNNALDKKTNIYLYNYKKSNFIMIQYFFFLSHLIYELYSITQNYQFIYRNYINKINYTRYINTFKKKIFLNKKFYNYFYDLHKINSLMSAKNIGTLINEKKYDLLLKTFVIKKLIKTSFLNFHSKSLFLPVDCVKQNIPFLNRYQWRLKKIPKRRFDYRNLSLIKYYSNIYVKLSRPVKLTNFFYEKTTTNISDYNNRNFQNTKKKYFYYHNLKLEKTDKNKINYNLIYKFEKKIKIFLQRNIDKFFFNTIYKKYFKLNAVITSRLDMCEDSPIKFNVFKENIFDHCFKFFKPKLYLLKI